MKYSKELKIGIFVVFVLVASFFLINYLRGVDIFNNEYQVTGEFDNVEGLVASAPVYIKGYKAGKVSEVNYITDKGNFEVICSIANQFTFPVDSKMTIYAVDIMGGKGVRIDLGNSDKSAEDGCRLQTDFEMGLLDGLGANLEPLLAKVENTLDSLTLLVSGVNKMISEDNVACISRTIANLEKTMVNVSNITKTVNGKSEELGLFMDNIAAFSKELEGIAAKLDSVLGEVDGVVGQLNESDIKGLVSSFKSLIENLNDPDGTINKLMKDDSIYNSVDSLLNDINVLVEKIQENPKKYLKISVF